MTSILWDMGGTLFDTYPYVDSAFARVTAQGGHEIDIDEIGRLTRVSRGHAIEALSARTGIPPVAFEDSYELVKEGWLAEVLPGSWTVEVSSDFRGVFHVFEVFVIATAA